MFPELHSKIIAVAEAAFFRNLRKRKRSVTEHRLGSAQAEIKDIFLRRTAGRLLEAPKERRFGHVRHPGEALPMQGPAEIRLYEMDDPRSLQQIVVFGILSDAEAADHDKKFRQKGAGKKPVAAAADFNLIMKTLHESLRECQLFPIQIEMASEPGAVPDIGLQMKKKVIAGKIFDFLQIEAAFRRLPQDIVDSQMMLAGKTVHLTGKQQKNIAGFELIFS